MHSLVKRRPAKGKKKCPHCHRSFLVRGYGRHELKCRKLKALLPLPFDVAEETARPDDSKGNPDPIPLHPMLTQLKMTRRPRSKKTTKYTIPATMKLRTVRTIYRIPYIFILLFTTSPRAD